MKHSHLPSIESSWQGTRYLGCCITGWCIQRSLHLGSIGSAAFRRTPTFIPKEGPNVKKVPRGRTTLPVCVPLFILLEFEPL